MAPSANIDDTTAAVVAAAEAAATIKRLSEPRDLTHHFSTTAKNRAPSRIKAFYRFIQIPGISNFSGGMPNLKYFPYDTLEAQVSHPDRWQPSPNTPAEVQEQIAAVESQAPTNGSTNGKSNGSSNGTSNGTSNGASNGESNGSSNGAASHGLNDPQHPDFDATSSHITVPKLKPVADRTQRIDLSTALQYGLSAGYPPLLSFIRHFTRTVLHPHVPYVGGADVILNCGATDGLSKTLQLLVDPWFEGVHDVETRPGVLCEAFVFGSTLSQVRPLGVQVVPVELDAEGMLAEGPGGLRDVLENWDPKKGRLPHLLYTVTMGHNPTSGVLSLERRKQLYAIASKYDIIIIEDEPYWYLQFPSAAVQQAKFRGIETTQIPEPHKPVKPSGHDFIDSLAPSYLSIDVDGRVVRLDTFSKTVAPGCRLGWITAQPAFIERLTRITESTTQQPSGFVQSLIAQLLIGPDATAIDTYNALPDADKSTYAGWKVDGWVRWLAGLRGEYERRMSRMCTVLEKNAYQTESSNTQLYSFDWPRGGMFVWVRVHFEKHPLYQARGGSDIAVVDGPALATAFLIHSTQAPHLVLGSPGGMFSATPELQAERGWQYVRLCFAAESDDNVDAGSERFVNAVQAFWRIKDVAEIERLVKELA